MASQEGYASVFVVTILAAISVTSIAMFSYAQAESRRAFNESERLLADIQLRSELNRALGNLLNGGQNAALAPASPATAIVSTSIIPLDHSADLNRSGLEEIGAALGRSGAPAELVSQISLEVGRRRSTGGKDMIKSLREFDGIPGFSAYRHCLAGAVSAFHSPVRGLHGSAPARTPDGSLVQLIVRAPAGATERILDVTILLTGDQAAPYWIMDWDWITSHESTDCDNAN